MKWNGIRKIAMGGLVAVVIALSSLATTASAQGRVFVPRHNRVIVVRRPFFPRYDPFYSYGYYPYSWSDPIAYQKESGYSDGLSRGKKDAKKGLPNSPESHKHFVKSSSLAYREAFEQGYNDGYNQQRG